METTQTTQEVANELNANLAQFSGTDGYHKFSIFSKLVITDGVKYLCEKAQAYWLMDIISSYQPQCNKDEMLKEFQIWILNVKDEQGKVLCQRDKKNTAFTQDIPYTDFPLDTIKLYCANGVILLPSEY